MCPIGKGQIHTSFHAGGITSSPIRSSDLGILEAFAALVDVLEPATASAPAEAGRRAVDSARRLLTEPGYPSGRSG